MVFTISIPPNLRTKYTSESVTECVRTIYSQTPELIERMVMTVSHTPLVVIGDFEGTAHVSIRHVCVCAYICAQLKYNHSISGM